MPELTPDDLKNMTPEQIAELQKQNCIFCHIVSGKVASRKVYEDDKCLAILDINPANPGHVLLMPKEHYAIMPLIPEDIIGHLFMVAKGISHACLKAFKVQGTNIFVANGVAAGQKAQHFMFHIIPRKEKDGISCFILPKKKMTDGQIEELRKILKRRVDFTMGIKGQEEDKQEMPEEKQAAKPEIEGEEKEAEFTETKEERKKRYEKKERGIEESGGEETGEKKRDEEEEEQEDSKEDEKIDLDKITELLGKRMGKK